MACLIFSITSFGRIQELLGEAGRANRELVLYCLAHPRDNQFVIGLENRDNQKQKVDVQSVLDTE